VLRYYESRRLFFLGAVDPPMSLKAKLEAVIYAAEEPVTLAQLAAIFADEVLPGLEEAAASGTEPILPAEPSPEAASPEAAVPDATPETPTSSAEEVSVAAEPVEGDEKKAARQRDRRVRQALQPVLDELIADYTNSDRGMEIREIAGGYRMATKPEYHDAVRGFVKSLKPPMKLSLQALETLAVIAYKQPVTAPEVSEIRGVDSGGVLGGLISRKLITTAGRKPVIGRPILYKTTKEFLLRFGLKDVNDLPSMEEFEKMAGELAESEAEGEAQDAVNLASTDDSSDSPQVEAVGEPVAESSEEVAVEPHTEQQV
jgi:segregation and condensation protein B